jgi:hypothetical protein
MSALFNMALACKRRSRRDAHCRLFLFYRPFSLRNFFTTSGRVR